MDDTFIKLLETVIDFDAARQRLKDKPAPFTDDEKYRGAGATKASGLLNDLDMSKPHHQAVGDFIQEIFTTWAAGREISAAQREKALAFVQLSYHSAKVTTNHAANKIVDAYNKQHPADAVWVQYRSATRHYVEEDETFLNYRVTRRKDRKVLFDDPHPIAYYGFIFTHLLPHVKDAFEISEIESWQKSLVNYIDGHDKHEAEETFDPKHRDEYQQSGTTPYVDRLAKRWRQNKEGEWGGTISVNEFDDPPSIILRPRFGIEGKKTFSSTRELSDYIEVNEDKLQRWYDRQQERTTPSKRAVWRKVRSMIRDAYERARNGNPRTWADWDDTRWLLSSTEDERFTERVESLIRDLGIPSLSKFFTKENEEAVLKMIEDEFIN